MQSPAPTLIRDESQTYDLVRAACVLLGRHSDPAVQNRLIEMVGSLSEIVSHNARFSLGYASDPRIRSLIERHKRARREDKAEAKPHVIKT